MLSITLNLRNRAMVIGKLIAAHMEATETYRPISKTINQIGKTISATRGIKPIITPADVATPFPPLNLSQIGNECPITQTTAPKRAKKSA